MKVLVLGTTGMAGHVMALHLAEAGHNVTGLSRAGGSRPGEITGDVRDQALLRTLLADSAFDVVVNCVGVLTKAAAEHQADAAYINAFLPHYLAELTSDSQTRVIHISTDCVFSGHTGPYTEAARPDADDFYGRSKALGELNDGKNLTLRTSIVGPDIGLGGIGLLTWFLQQDGPIDGYSNVLWTGVTTLVLAQAAEAAATSGVTGLYHLTNNVPISKFDLLGLFNTYLRHRPVRIRENDAPVSDKSLVNTRTDFGFHVPSTEEMVRELRAWMLNHAGLYSHYTEFG